MIDFPTRGDATLDIVITDVHTLYKNKPITKLYPDKPEEGSPMDHIPVLCEPINNNNINQPIKGTNTKTIRPITTDQLMSFGDWITKENWNEVKEAPTVDKKVEAFDKIISSKLDLICPEKKVTCSVRDKPWINSHIKIVIRDRKREYEKNGKSLKWKALSKKSKELVSKAKKSYVSNILDKLKDTNNGVWYATIKRLGAANGDIQDGNFNIMKHEDKDDKEICEEIADYFSAISQEYDPIDRDLFPAHWKQPNYPNNGPILQEYEVYKLIKE